MSLIENIAASEMLDRFLADARHARCSRNQIENFLRAGIILQPKQLAASAAARLCDAPDGPTAIGYGGARGGGKSHWLIAQLGVDDCQRVPDLKCLLLRKVGKANNESFADLRQRLFRKLPHEFVPSRGLLHFPNGSRIITGHYQHVNDIDAYLGLEYDVIGIEEATALTSRKYTDIGTCCRTSKPRWRPRIYSTTNPGGVGHAWYRQKFLQPFHANLETDTRFVPASISDNPFTNPDYQKTLQNLSGWRKRAWLYGDWDIAAGQFFTTFRRDIHVISDFDDSRAVEWMAALDYGFTHYTVVLLGCKDGDGNYFIVDEHAERLLLPQKHAQAIHAMFRRHGLLDSAGSHSTTQLDVSGRSVLTPQTAKRQQPSTTLVHFVAGADVFSRQSDGHTIADQYRAFGIRLLPANTDRINGWAEVLRLLGDVDSGLTPQLFIHKRCARLIECLPNLQHDPNNPEDILKTDIDDDGSGGDDAADALRYLVATRPRRVYQRKLRGF